MPLSVDVSYFKDFFHPSYIADSTVQGSHEQKWNHILAIIKNGAERGKKKISIDAEGLDRPLLMRCLLLYHPRVMQVFQNAMQLKIEFKHSTEPFLEGDKVCWPDLDQTHHLSSYQTYASCPASPPDAKDDTLAQNRHLAKINSIFDRILQACNEKKNSVIIKARGYDRLFIKSIFTHFFPKCFKLVQSNYGHFKDELQIEFNSEESIREQINEFRFCGSSTMIEAAPLMNHNTMHTLKSPRSSFNFPDPPKWSESNITARDFLEAYLVFGLKSLKLSGRKFEESLVDELSNLLKNLPNDELFISHLKFIFLELAECEEIPIEHRKYCKDIGEYTNSVSTFLERYRQLPRDMQALIHKRSGGMPFISFLEELPKYDPHSFSLSVWSRYSIETRSFKIPKSYWNDHPSPCNIELEQIKRSYFPNGVAIRINDTPFLSEPKNSAIEDQLRNFNYYQSLLKAFNQIGHEKFSFEGLKMKALVAKLLGLKEACSATENEILLLLRLGTFSAWGHADDYLRNVLLSTFLTKNKLKYLSQENQTTEFFIDPTGQFCIIQNRAYAILDESKAPIINFSFECKIISAPKEEGEFQYHLSFSNLSMPGVKDIKQKEAIYAEFFTALSAVNLSASK